MKNTFGNSPAALKLETMVENNPSARRKISSLLSNYTHRLLETTVLKNEQLALLYMDLLRNYTLKQLDAKHKLPSDIRNYAKNLVQARYRAYRHGFSEVMQMIKNKPKS